MEKLIEFKCKTLDPVSVFLPQRVCLISNLMLSIGRDMKEYKVFSLTTVE